METAQLPDLTIESILDSHDKVYVDSTMVNAPTSITEGTFNASDFSYLDTSLLDDHKDFLKAGIELLRHPSTYTVSDVTDELFSLLNHIGTQLSFFGNKSKRLKQKSKRKHERLRNKEKHLIGSDGEQIYRQIHDDTFEVCRLSRRYELQNSSPEYLALFDIVGDIKDSLVHNIREEYDLELRGLLDEHDSDTEVTLTAHVLYECLFNKKQGVLLSRNSKFIDLLAKSKRYLGNNYKSIADALTENSPLLYFIGAQNNGEIQKRDFLDDKDVGTKSELEDYEGFYGKVGEFARKYEE